MDQRTALLKFLREVQGKKSSKDENISGEFLRLKRQSVKNKHDKTYSAGHAEKQENVKKNRYKDIIPFDHSRVQLSLIISDSDSDYINASFIKGVYGPHAYIATQGPLPHTVMDFWRMLWEYNVVVVVMACREFEMGRKKCERYWANKGEDPYCTGPFSITCEQEEVKPEYIIRTLKVHFQSINRTMYQLHYVNWPDHDIPSSIDPILELIKDMRKIQPHDDVPICVHCSAGCGRTGVICAIDYTWKLLKDEIIPENFSIYNLIQEMRTQRPSVVQTKEQYELVYRAISDLFEKQLELLNTNPSFSIDEVNELPVTLERPERPPKPIQMSTNSPCHRSPKEERSSQFKVQELPLVNQHNQLGFFPIRHSQSHGLITDLNNSSSKYEDISQRIQDPTSCIATCPPERGPGRQMSLGLDRNVERTSWGELSQNLERLPHNTTESASKQCLTRAKSNPFNITSQDLDEPKASPEIKEYNHLGSLELLSILSNDSPSTKCNSLPPVGKTWSPCHWEAAQEDKTNVLENTRSQSFMHLGSQAMFPTTYSTEDPYFSPPGSSLEDSMFSCPDLLCQHLDSLTSNKPRSENEYGELPPCPSYFEPIRAQHMEEKWNHRSLVETEVVKENNSDDETPPPLPERTPESYILPENPEPVPVPPASLKIGTSLEWSGCTQARVFTESVNVKTRSKSLKLRGFRKDRKADSLAIPSSLSLPQCASDSSPSTETHSPRSSPDPNKAFTRSKSMKILRSMKKTISSVPALSRTPVTEPSTEQNRSFLNFGFKNRFVKPKGSRNPSPDWV
ncbi:tyrosine-protein phosphatase non-receptor type 22-like isoform X2 [Pristis pectinata]|uniref:tyrosine-protein phosphatase non-receptor type 22-like isoform X2 n=1 Tax=Pristis pectinata TaxID=685728 RepID=UPI00223D3BAA|nr:tyrosine-protein phosphatase non-receptor type 22-like isoform X2 [Pristis pectinata]